MKIVTITNINNGQLLADQVKKADNFFTRLKGLMGVKKLNPGQGIIIMPCNMVHTIGMKINIDVIFIDEAGEIIHVIEAMPPNRFSPHVKKACYVLELAAGQVCSAGVLTGDRVSII